MLMITRRVGQSIEITLEDGRKLLLRVTRVWGRQAKVGITAPKEMRVTRIDDDHARKIRGAA